MSAWSCGIGPKGLIRTLNKCLFSMHWHFNQPLSLIEYYELQVALFLWIRFIYIIRAVVPICNLKSLLFPILNSNYKVCTGQTFSNYIVCVLRLKLGLSQNLLTLVHIFIYLTQTLSQIIQIDQFSKSLICFIELLGCALVSMFP